MSVFYDQARLMRAFGQKTTEFDAAQVGLYLNMLVEETGETLCAANPDRATEIKALIDQLHKLTTCAPNYDRVELFDGLLDVHVIAAGVGVSADLPMEVGWEVVFESNWQKVDPATGKVVRNAAGKVQKPEGWVPSTERLKGLLAAQEGEYGLRGPKGS